MNYILLNTDYFFAVNSARFHRAEPSVLSYSSPAHLILSFHLSPIVIVFEFYKKKVIN